MKKLEVFYLLFVFTGVLFKKMEWPFANLMVVVGMSSLAILYYPFAFALLQNIKARHLFKKQAYVNITAASTVLAVLAGLALAILCVGLMFKWQFWSHSHSILNMGLVVTAIAALLIFILLRKQPFALKRNFFRRASILFAFGLLFRFTPATTFADIIYHEQPCYRDALKAVMANPNNPEVRKRWDNMKKGIYPADCNDNLDTYQSSH
ncbi:MAG: hypothetical protein ACKVOR_02125 [Flavobacteriales bacterium]